MKRLLLLSLLLSLFLACHQETKIETPETKIESLEKFSQATQLSEDELLQLSSDELAFARAVEASLRRALDPINQYAPMDDDDDDGGDDDDDDGDDDEDDGDDDEDDGGDDDDDDGDDDDDDGDDGSGSTCDCCFDSVLGEFVGEFTFNFYTNNPTSPFLLAPGGFGIGIRDAASNQAGVDDCIYNAPISGPFTSPPIPPEEYECCRLRVIQIATDLGLVL